MREASEQGTKRLRRRVGAVVASLAITGGMIVVAASPAFASSITSAGPLTRVEISPELNCAVDHSGDAVPEFFDDTACATLLAVGSTLFGPSNIPAGGSASPRTTFTTVSQSAVTGTGTSGDPFTVVTVVDLGTTGLRITQTDSYVIGQEAYRTDVKVANSGAQQQVAQLYRAGDCYLQNSDFGFGEVDAATGSVACVSGVSDGQGGVVPGPRIEQWVPLSAGSHYFEDSFNTVWAGIGSQQAFPDTCECSIYQDNGAGLSWQITIPAGGSVTRSHLTNFSPLGTVPLTTTKTADTATAPAGSTDGYTITLHNSNSVPANLASVSDTLPAGFSYVPGSTTGATTSNPSIAAQTLTWAGPISVPASGSASLHFNAVVSSTPGEYFNNAGADGGSFVVLPTGDTAKITVSGAGPTATTTTYGGDSSVQYSDAATLTGNLSATSGGAPIPGKTLDFVVGTQNASAGPTDVSGNASTALTVTQTPGSVSTVQTSFAGDSGFSPSSDSDPFSIAKEDCTLAYTGDTLVNAASMTTLKAQFGEPDASPGDWTNKSVTFTVKDASLVTQTFLAITDSAGVATVTAALGPNVYGVKASFAGDAYYEACATASDTLVTVQAANAKITGGGWVVAQSTGHTSFGFNVIQDVTGLKGQLQVRSKAGKSGFHGSTVVTLNSSGNTGTWTGVGRWNRTDGATFTVSVVDNGSGGKKAGDTISIEIKVGTNVVFTTNGPQPLKGGNITVH